MNRPSQSPALYLAAASMVVGLGSGAFAAFSLPQHSVGTPQLQPDAVTGAKVAHRTLTGDDIRASTLGKVPKATHAKTADAAGAAYSVHNESGFDVQPLSPVTVAALDLPKGSYVLMFKAQVDTFSNQQIIGCDLVAGGAKDQSFVQGSSAMHESSMIVNNVATIFVSSGVAKVSCQSFFTSTHISHLRLTAIRVGSVTVKP